MRHPFDGINQPTEATSDGVTRRTALGHIAAGAAGLLGLASAAHAQLATTKALGEEGGPVLTTQAIGEEGAATVPPATTEPFGEEAGKVVSRAMAGLEDGGKPAGGGVTTEALGEEGGPVATTLALGEEGGPSTRAVGEEGAFTKAKGEDGRLRGPLVPVKPDSTELDDKQLETAWDGLGDKDAARGVQSCAMLYGDKKAIPFLKKKLKADAFKTPEVDDKIVDGLIADLNSDTFSKREKASAELARVAHAILPRLEKEAKESSSAEQRMRLTRLVETASTHSIETQGRRGLEVLVALQSPAAKELLENLGKGPEKEWLTKAAQEALARVK
jgi:hypothetical protein